MCSRKSGVSPAGQSRDTALALAAGPIPGYSFHEGPVIKSHPSSLAELLSRRMSSPSMYACCRRKSHHHQSVYIASYSI
jgi:hypothetical protein